MIASVLAFGAPNAASAATFLAFDGTTGVFGNDRVDAPTFDDSDARRQRRPSPDTGITAMLNSTSIEFASADRDRSGEVSAHELADLTQQTPAAA